MWKWADDKTKGRGSWNWVPGSSPLFITWHGRFSRDWEIFAGKGGVTRQRGVLLWQVTGDHCGQVRCRIVNCRCVCFVPGYEDPEDCGITMCSSVHVHENRVWTIIIWLTRPLWSAARPTLTTKPRIENIESSIETWLKNGVRLSGLAGICCSLWLEFVLVTVCCRRRHWAAFTFNCKLLVLASSKYVPGTLGGLWTLKSWMK